MLRPPKIILTNSSNRATTAHPFGGDAACVRYEIRIAGALSASLLGAFPAFNAKTCGPETVLVGELPDQAALHGVLAQVEALGLSLLEVRRRPRLESLEPGDDDSPHRRRVSPPVRERSNMEPLDDAVDHVRGAPTGRLIVEYGDYECPYSRRAFREIELVERRPDGDVRFAFRHFPLTEIHPHALAASAAAEAAALQDRFWEMHELLFHRQKALEDDDLVRYAGELGLDVARSSASGPAPRCSAAFAVTSRAGSPPARCKDADPVHRRAGAPRRRTTPPACWRR